MGNKTALYHARHAATAAEKTAARKKAQRKWWKASGVPVAKRTATIEWLSSVASLFVVLTTRPNAESKTELEKFGFKTLRVLPPVNTDQVLGNIKIPAKVQRLACFYAARIY